jgi:hypothetical protein
MSNDLTKNRWITPIRPRPHDKEIATMTQIERRRVARLAAIEAAAAARRKLVGK